MSAELQWACIRNSSCFLVKRTGGVFSSEPNNLANKHAYKFSSVQRKTVGVRSAAGNKGIDFVTKRSKFVRHPAKMFITRRLTRDRRKVYRTIRRKLGKDNYRRDLIEPAVRRASAILTSQRPRKTAAKKT